MKLFMPRISWEGDYQKYFTEAFQQNGVEVMSNSNTFHRNRLIGFLGLRAIDGLRRSELRYYIEKYNKYVLRECLSFKPDVFFVFNESKLTSDTLLAIRKYCKCKMVLRVGDDPWDSIRWQVDFPHNLKHYDIIFSADPIWNNNIRKVAPRANIYWSVSGYDESSFTPVENAGVTPRALFDRYSCDLSFVGSSYGIKAEGAYRADILSYLCDFNLKIWGGDNWEYRFRANPQLRDRYQGGKIPRSDLRYLYSLSKINLNIPAPQITLYFQPRVFEMAACMGFQIADSRLLLSYLFSQDELVTFDSIDDLREKVVYYLAHDQDRRRITENLHKRIYGRYSWRQWANRTLHTIRTGEGIRDLDKLLIRTDDSEIRGLLSNA